MKNGARIEGTIKFFNQQKGFGFILFGMQDIFFHISDLPADETVDRGDTVGFSVEETRKGNQAKNIEILKRAARKRGRDAEAEA